MSARYRSLAWLAAAAYFASCLLLARSVDAPPLIQAAGAFGLGGSTVLGVVWWNRAEHLDRNPTPRRPRR